MSNSKNIFVAYASKPAWIGAMIEEGCEIANKFSNVKFNTWRQNDIVGLDLVAPIIEAIESAEYVVADISLLNNNVVYEIGYAIGLGKRVILVRHSKSEVSAAELNRVGIFDTLGYETYNTALEFANKVSTDPSSRKLEVNFEANKGQPLYVVGCANPNHISHRIASRIKKSRLVFRSFTPSEEIRMSASTAIENIASSLGVVLEWRDGSDEVSNRHNIRTAFCAGLSHALKIETIIFAPSGAIVPLDFRNSTVQVARTEDIDDGMADFVPCVAEALQDVRKVTPAKASKIVEIHLGDPSAENEMRALDRYFFRSATFAAAMKGDVRTIVGRKGSGKTAIWSQIRNNIRKSKKNTVVDLKPEGYQLVKLREDVLVHLSMGQGLHVAMAFWEFLLLLEIGTKVVEDDKTLYTRDQRLTEGYEALAEMVSDYNGLGDTDFSERLHKFSINLAGTLSSDRDFMRGDFKGHELTNKIYAIDRLCCTNPDRDSRWESSMIAGMDEQLGPYEVQDQELAFVQHSAEATRIAVDLV